MSLWERLVEQVRRLVEQVRASIRHLRHLTSLAHLTSHRRNESGYVSVPVGSHLPVITERVERGAALLDRRQPGWYRYVDPHTVRIESATNCVLGQQYGHYLSGLMALHVEGEAVQHGFDADYLSFGDRWLEYRALNREWQSAIAQRRARV